MAKKTRAFGRWILNAGPQQGAGDEVRGAPSTAGTTDLPSPPVARSRWTPGDTPRFTANQGQYLAFIWAYSEINGRAPAEADFQRYFKVTAPSVHQMLRTLDQIGLIKKQPSVARSIQLLGASPELHILSVNQPVLFTATGH